MIAIIDYGVGNLFSLKSSITAVGHSAEVTNDASVIRRADHVILPGVGAFGDAVAKLKSSGMFDVVRAEAASGKPLIGICVGMQMLFERDYEFGEWEGLGLISGEVRFIGDVIAPGLKTPAIGWSGLNIVKPGSKLFAGIADGEYMYFVHSYAAFDCGRFVSAYTDYGARITASVEHGNVYGTQFHPEKSGPAGLKILKNFCEL